MLGTSKLLLVLAVVHQTLALSSHSPRDLEALPAYAVVLNEHGVLNDTVGELLSEDLQAPTHAYPPKRHLLRTPSGQAFLCTVPAVTDDSRKKADAQAEQDALVRARERERGLEHGLALLEPMRQGCLYLRQGWFTYSFCYGSEIRQFHAHELRTPGSTGPTEDPNAEAYTLGMMPEPSAVAAPKYGSGRQSTALQVPTKLGGGDGVGWDEGGRYLSQVWDSGTICDKTGLPREVEVQFHCDTQTIDRIAHIRETSICHYVMLVYTPRLCGERLFLEGHNKNQEPAASIECQPVVKRLQEQLPDTAAIGAEQLGTAAAPPPHALPPLAHPLAAPRAPPPAPVPAPPATPADPAGASHATHADSGELKDLLDEILDLEGSLTLVYDADSGEIESVVTEYGEDVYIDSELKKQLFGEVVQAAVGEAAAKDEKEVEEKRQKTTEETLEDLAKLMHDTIADALRAHAHPGAAGEEPRAAPAGALAAANPVEALLDVIRRTASSASDDGAAREAPEKPLHPGLHNYLQSFQKAKRTMQVPPEAVLGSEAHERLKQRFARRYEAEEQAEKVEEGKRRVSPSAEDGVPPHDEL
ncbi:Protein OS-9 [Rhodotorula kratochvilovae]